MNPPEVIAKMIDTLRAEFNEPPIYEQWVKDFGNLMSANLLHRMLNNTYNFYMAKLTRYRVDIVTPDGEGEVLISAVDANRAMHHAIQYSILELGVEVQSALCTEKWHKIKVEK